MTWRYLPKRMRPPKRKKNAIWTTRNRRRPKQRSKQRAGKKWPKGCGPKQSSGRSTSERPGELMWKGRVTRLKFLPIIIFLIMIAKLSQHFPYQKLWHFIKVPQKYHIIVKLSDIFFNLKSFLSKTSCNLAFRIGATRTSQIPTTRLGIWLETSSSTTCGVKWKRKLCWRAACLKI